MKSKRIVWLLALVALLGTSTPAGENAGENNAGEETQTGEDAGDADEIHARIIGTWEMTTEFQGQEIEATMEITMEEGRLAGTWHSMGQEMTLTDLEFDGEKLSFARTMGAGGQALTFTGLVEENSITGAYQTPSGERLPCKGRRQP